MMRIFQKRQLCWCSLWLLIMSVMILSIAPGWCYAPIQEKQFSSWEEGALSPDIDLVIRAAMAGWREEQFQLGTLYDEGGALAPDYETAAFWYNQAAVQNHHQAQLRLGILYYSGLIGARAPEPDYNVACPLFEQAANQNIDEAMFYLGSCSLLQQQPANWSRARYWFEKAAKKGQMQAQFLLGQFYEEGQGVEKNREKARQFYHAAAQRGHAQAAFKLGHMLEMQEEPDYHQIAIWYKKAAMLGYSRAFSPLARLYYQGLGLPQDYGAAYHWFEKAAQMGDGVSAFNLGVMLSQGNAGIDDERKARFWYGQAAQKGEVAAQYNLAMLYEEGRGGERDLVQALHFYQMAAQGGEVDALVKIGSFYEQGLGVKVDKARALRYYQRAALMGDKDMQYYLGMFYHHDTHLSEPDYDQARFWLEKAASQGHVQAERQLNRLDQCYFEAEKMSK